MLSRNMSDSQVMKVKVAVHRHHRVVVNLKELKHNSLIRKIHCRRLDSNLNKRCRFNSNNLLFHLSSLKDYNNQKMNWIYQSNN